MAQARRLAVARRSFNDTGRQLGSFGLTLAPVALVAAGAYLALRGGGAWAMDIYVQKMQDRVRQRELS